MSNIIPAKRVVVCTPLEVTKTKSGLHLSTGEDGKKPELGKIVAIGQGVLPLDIKVGDTIVYRRYTDNLVPVKGKEYNFIEFKDIMAKV